MKHKTDISTKTNVKVEGKMTPEDSYKVSMHHAVTARIAVVLLFVAAITFAAISALK